MMMMMMLIACMAAINDNADNAYDNADYMGDEDFINYDINGCTGGDYKGNDDLAADHDHNDDDDDDDAN